MAASVKLWASGLRALRQLYLLAALSAAIYAGMAWLSLRFAYGTPGAQRPMLAVLALLIAEFVAYLWAIRASMRAVSTRNAFRVIVVSSVLFRVILLPSHPIQEVDIYRYLWDGEVVTSGVSPFRYRPEQVRRASRDDGLSKDLHRLVEAKESDPATAEILRRVHFPELPTVYPTVSQFVFAAATVSTPPRASVWTRVCVMKSWLVVFDLATLWCVVQLLGIVKWPKELAIVYGWCPLLMKEFANSGHLDSIAVFLTTFAIYLVARLPDRARATDSAFRRSLSGFASLAVLALATGAKLYPVILTPLLAVWIARKVGWWRAMTSTIAMLLLSAVLLWPMVRPANRPAQLAFSDPPLPIPSGQAAVGKADPSLGLRTFLRRWEINDFLFLVVVENLKPTTQVSSQEVAWFALTPDDFRRQLVRRCREHLHILPRDVPFLAARVLTGAVFVGIAAWLIHRTSRMRRPEDWLEASFLTLAWFWLLCPTQNPWYWTWALPLLPFARHRAWLVMSGAVFLYYTRFWLTYHWADTQILGTPYRGAAFFDLVVTWLEYAPWFLWLILARRSPGKRRREDRPRTGWGSDDSRGEGAPTWR